MGADRDFFTSSQQVALKHAVEQQIAPCDFGEISRKYRGPRRLNSASRILRAPRGRHAPRTDGDQFPYQLLLIPIILNLDNLVIKDYEKKLENLGKFGLKIDVFGSNSVIVREIPALVSDCNVKNLVDAVINDMANENSLNYLETEVNKICSTIACHGSIRSGRKLEVEEMNDLLRKMENTKNSGQCNHGRPTFIKLNIVEIEKLFGRK